MKKYLVLLLTFITLGTMAQEQKAPQSPKVTHDNEFLSVTYSSPSKRGREIFGKLVPYGEVWRTGANEATQVTFKKDVTFGDKKVKAGTYSLFTFPGEKEWKVILNTDLKQWGAFGYNEIKDKNVAEVTVPSKKQSPALEKFEINVDKNELTIAWDETKVSVPLRF